MSFKFISSIRSDIPFVKVMVVLLVLFITGTSFGQESNLKFDHLTTANGLPQDHVFAILEDNKGFLWLGMESGLARYDGYNFKTFTHDIDDPTSISSNIIRSLYQDKKGFIWVGTDGGGVCRYDPSTERFTNYKHDPSDPNSLSGNRVYEIAEDKQGAIWLGTLTEGLTRIYYGDSLEDQDCNSMNPCFTRFSYNPDDPNSLGDDDIWTMIIDSKNRLWAGTVSAGLNMLELDGRIEKDAKFIKYSFENDDQGSLSNSPIKAIYEDSQGTLWVGTEFQGIKRLDEKSGSFTSWQYQKDKPETLSHNHVSSILEDRTGRLWIGTNGGGINIFNKETETFTRYEFVPADPYSLSGNLVSTIHESSTGILWIGMVNKGLNWIDPNKQKVNHYYPIPGKEGSLNGNLIKAIYEDKTGDIWIGAYGGGLNHFNPETGYFTNYLQSIDGGNAGNNNIQRIYEDSRNRLWIGTDGGGLFEFDRNKKVFLDFNDRLLDSKLSGNGVWSIHEDLKGNLWVGTADGGLNRIDWQTSELTYFNPVPDKPGSINSNDVRVIFEDHVGVIWIGTYGGGLNKYNPVDQSFIYFKNEPGAEQSISNNIITDIFESSKDQKLWIGTFGGGINRFDRSTGSFINYREKDGLSNDVVKSIEEDNLGNLWFSTLKGISKFNPASETFVNFTMSDGLQGNGYNLGASCKREDGTMYFGGTNGFNVFSPSEITMSTNESYPCLITDLKIFNRSIQPGEEIQNNVILNKTIDETEEISIPYFIDGFAFEFASLDFARSETVVYAHQMEGVNNDWILTDANLRYASYSNLDPGAYLFKVRASNSWGGWNGQITKLKVNILPAPWNTKWAYLIYFSLFLFSIYMLRRYYYARFKLKNELKIERLERKKIKELNEMKMRFFTNISHEIRTPLTLILGPIQELIESGEANLTVREHLTNINKNANRLLTLVNQLLEFRKQESGFTQLQIAKGDIVNFISEAILSFKEVAHRRNIDFSFTHDPEVIAVWYDNSQMEKVIFNLLSNAFKFTLDGGKIEVIATKSDDKVKIVVEDNGKGISEGDLPFIFDRFHKFNKDYSGNYLGSGIGLALVKGIIDLHKGSIEVESELNSYTRFIIELPLGMMHFKDEEIVTDYKDSEDKSHYILHNQDENYQENSGLPIDAPELLIVEDHHDVRKYLCKLFASQYKIWEAADGKEGWKLALEHSPDLIISDIMMPEMDGLQFCNKLKTSLETSHIPIILITARSSSFYKAKGLETGADDYITKPFDPKLLKIRVRNLIASRKRLREKFNRNLALEPQEISITSPDQELLKKAIDAVEKHMDDSEFDVNGLATEIGVSRPVLYRKLPAITDSTPNEFIRIIRLKRAAQILSKVELPISEVCYMTGFKTPKHFSKSFRDQFKVLPSEYAKREKEKRDSRS